MSYCNLNKMYKKSQSSSVAEMNYTKNLDKQ